MTSSVKPKPIPYPDYMPRFVKGKPRLYTEQDEAAKRYKMIKGHMPPNSYECHHVDLDRSNGSAENLFWVKPKEHTDLHQQVQQFFTNLFKIGFFIFNPKGPNYEINPKYSNVIKDLHNAMGI